MATCRHFEPGTSVVVDNRPGVVYERHGDTLWVLWDDTQWVTALKPYALSGEG